MGANGAVVIGIGNRLRGDDALGPIVADALRERLSVPVGTVMSRLYKARRTLEKRLIKSTQPKSSVQYLRKVK